MKDTVKEYYGKVLQHSGDLQTNACCTDAEMPGYLRDALSNIHDEVMARYYGCGLVSPQLLEGARILDLGSGSGRDCYALAQMVGESGYVLGVDMTEEQLEVANRHVEWHRERFGYAKSNVEFRKGYIEKLDELGLEGNSFDIIVSNCVINLSPDKEAVLREAYRLLKPGGELYFSDVYSDRRVPEHLISDPVLYGECLSGALYWNDFQNLAKKAGFADPRLVEDRPITIDNPEIEEKIGYIGFYSATYRLFKLDGLEPACEDYGQAVVYKGGIPESEQAFALDNHHIIDKGRMFLVCGNTYRMLNETRFSEYFEFYGNWDTH
ncbi:methyltransferase domain-containing protein, partial [endosymbiont of Lamellibrachia barhami]|uniref:methyltransferase domain-containing protein n=1 Tax=endosymbiont of Lamellibrachia barhami TaxID=205975 RepID=UPI0015AEA047